MTLDQRRSRAFEQLRRNREERGVEVSDREVADRGTLGFERPDLGGDAEDLRPYDAAGKGREAAIGLGEGRKERRDVHGLILSSSARSSNGYHHA